MTQRWTIPLLVLAFIAFYLLPLGTHGLWIPDETRYAQIGQQILVDGNWITPHFMDLRYFEKPIAGYWMIAIGQAIFGENLFGVRIASAIATGLSVFLAYAVARRLWNDPRKSFACALVYMTFGLIAGQAGYSNLDPQFTLWVNLSLVALWFAVDSRTTRDRLISWAVLGFACGMGFMTKGFLALLLPVLIALPYMVWQKRFLELVKYGLVAMLVAALVSLPWILAVHAQEPDYWNFFFWHEHIRRFAGEDAQHGRPWWFYLPLMVVASLPWVALLPATFKDAWQNKPHASVVFLLMWLLLPLALFSLSKGKLPTYIMPCMLPLALLLGHAMMQRVEQAKTGSLRLNGLLNLLIGGVALLALIYFQIKKPFYDNEPQHMALLVMVLLTWIVTGLLTLSRPLKMWAAPAVAMGVLVLALPAAMPTSVIHNKMPDQFILEHMDELSQAKTLLSNDLGAASALSWRLRRPDVTLYNTQGEVKYGLTYDDAKGKTISLADIGQWMTDARRHGPVGVVMRVKDSDESDEMDHLPKDAKRYDEGNMVILIFPQITP
ncbi:lipid IV(A) 4-amino-4-deoxy-L-arabinosyltransferase [Pseudomonas sp. CCI3.1]|uniref:lipid IV(A) 4-amino-4-deoxy-L-arabinosyltransferase n=1 Tax=Pseudomonas sp. CCI3.1 TaxID=3048618 RepID=UPI002AB48D52|nr:MULTISPECIES: lipid IV(A) 4-amino-4-deoxy-L-arabinosyltransferase [unclassified Pseudomonas]MDY7580414.1 lipid IV(A) 4-amino-4-deoxy-L-arabinosyltransferase [Pseudomonas sp. CCI3.1]MEB0067261.1 lipid IV(A) 4-amino-4-deoxy-L-arabinosyltransferase [Pseudomonas sp. CCI3.1]MEB0072856.1 lipid IV(A) 4-amino-4-deoxy-L-arabinosyltransferase [Pseudomonas sp. CCI1.4]